MDPRPRIVSVDAFRGLTVAAMLLVNDPGDWGHVLAPLQHSSWNGCTATDLVFPFFLFIVGVSIALRLIPRDGTGEDSSALARGVLLRALRIVALGLALHAVAHWMLATPSFRPFGVLQRIGLCFAAAGLLAIYTRPRTQWLVLGAILLGYWAAMAWDEPLTKEGNLASRVDTALLGRFAYEFDPVTGRGHEPEGLLSTLPAIATTLLGVRSGEWLRRGDARRLLKASIACLVIGGLWSLAFPLNKNLWTSSFVLWTGGWALFTLLLFHLAIDRRGWPAIGRSMGVNAIAIYAGAWLMECVLEGLRLKALLYAQAFAWMKADFGPFAPSLAYAVAFVAFWWAIAAWMERRGIRITI